MEDKGGGGWGEGARGRHLFGVGWGAGSVWVEDAVVRYSSAMAAVLQQLWPGSWWRDLRVSLLSEVESCSATVEQRVVQYGCDNL